MTGKIRFKAKTRTVFVTPGRTYRLVVPRKGKAREAKKVVKTVHIPGGGKSGKTEVQN